MNNTAPWQDRAHLRVLIRKYNKGKNNLDEIIKTANKILPHGVPTDPELKEFFTQYLGGN